MLQEQAVSTEAEGTSHPDVDKKVAHQENVVHVDPALVTMVAANVDDFLTLVNEANEANDREQHLGVWTTMKLYPKAIMWSVIISSAIIMEGYDTAVVGSYSAFPAFTSRFGTLAPNGSYNIAPRWASGISGATNCGEILGLQFAGFFSERIGYRYTIIGALVTLIGFIFIPFFANSLAVFLVGELFQGMAWGVFQTMTTAYAAEVCPVPLRHFLTSYVNMCWIIGQFISSGVLVRFETQTDPWGYKIPFAIQWIWPVPLIVGIFLAPESPWWYIRHGKKSMAEKSLKRLVRKTGASQREIDANIALMVYTNEVEKQIIQGVSYWDCFKGTNLRRTEIVCMIWMAQALTGNALSGAYFFENAGISASSSFKLQWGVTAIGFVGNVASWFILNRVGRRTWLLTGLLGMLMCLTITGCLGLPSPMATSESWAAGGSMMVFSCLYDISIGPLVYVIVAEIPSSRLRSKSIVLARNAYNIVSVAFVGIVAYRQLDTLAWNWGAKAGLFWAGINAIMTVWAFFRLPETKGRTYIELDMLFESKISARNFAKTKTSSLTEDGDVSVGQAAGT